LICFEFWFFFFQGRYLKEFDLDRAMLLADGLEKWSRNEMMLGAETLTNLNVLGKDSSSLLHLCDRTVSSYGSRTLSHWLGHPLMSKDEIIARQDAVQSVRELFVTQGVLCAADLKNKVCICLFCVVRKCF
jgi:DNA mismatch repair ATPase MutS